MKQKKNIGAKLLPNLPPGSILSEIRKFMEVENIPLFRFVQLVGALQRGIENFQDVKELPKDVRQLLMSRFGETPLPLNPVLVQSAEQVEKVLFETQTKAYVETVHSRYRAGWSSVCISSQAGCNLGCAFCATGATGFTCNLSADEICAQVVHSLWQKSPDSISFMGMGEALANPHFFEALSVLTSDGYGSFSPRRVTVSTVGFAPNLHQLTTEYPQVNVTLSVHSPFADQRAELIPLERRFSLKENLSILNQHTIKTHRKVYLAYLLISGVNDSIIHLKALEKLVKSQKRPELFHVNVIGYNNAVGAKSDYKAPTEKNIIEFVSELRVRGISATRRQQFGASIDAACGQLYAKNFL